RRTPDAASAAVGRLRDRFPQEPVLRALQIEVSLLRGRFDDAASQITALRSLASGKDDADYLSALTWARREQWSQAQTEASALLKRRPDHLRARLLLIQALIVQKREAEALSEADEAVRRAPGLPSPALVRADLLERMGRRPEAVAALE